MCVSHCDIFFLHLVVHFWVVIGGDWGAGVPVRVDTVSCTCEHAAGYRWLIACKVTFM